MPHETLIGGSCYTASEAQKLLNRINKQASVKAQSIHGNWLYYIDLKQGQAGLDKVQQLLQVSDASKLTFAAENGVTLYISPRNISPWSSKATSIAHVCGLKEQVHRVERGRVITIQFEGPHDGPDDLSFRDIIHDRMTETITTEQPSLDAMFLEGDRAPLVVVDIFADGGEPLSVLQEYNQKMGLALSPEEMQYLVDVYTKLGRPPHDVELFMFAQVNSEHCRHKVFNAAWTIDGKPMGKSLFEMIKNTHKKTPDYTVSAYSDNAAVLQGDISNFWAPDYSTGTWKLTSEVLHPLIKVETHNHPTAISPFPGAATGSGGEIRDEGAVGRGSIPKAGLCGFWVSDLHIPGKRDPWEVDIGRPGHYASSLDIMLEAPIGSARFNNEFGRPCLTGTFRTLLTNGNGEDASPDWRGYHKPIMIAGGLGSVRPQHALKNESDVHDGAYVIVLGGPAMLIGLGGGAASSAVGGGNADLDFDSVQRGNPEMERRAQMVINTCVALGQNNPIAMIHDVGAGGLSNALPELVKDAGFGGKFELRQVESADDSMSPLQVWCNEAQERYVLLVNRDSINRFQSICERERCGFSNVGNVVTKDDNGTARLILTDRESKEYPVPIDLPMDALFPPGRRQERVVETVKKSLAPFDAAASLTEKYGLSDRKEMIAKATELVFSLPSVGSKMFLITIADRTVGGLTVQDQLVGPWQTPVADVAVTLGSFSVDEKTRHGEAMAMGEKPTLALISPGASARMAVVESLMNLGAAHIKGAADVRGDLRRVKLSANWMAAVNHPGEGAALFEAVKAIGMDLCPELKVSIPVGKDSTSMKASWQDESGESKSVTAPVSVVISAFTPVEDVRSTWTPQLRRVEEVGESILIFVDLARGYKAMGGSALAQVLGQLGHEAPDVRDTRLVVDYFDALSQLHEENIVLAYHDRSDGGLLTTIAEMMFAGRCAVDISIDELAKNFTAADALEALFNEELGAVFQIRKSDERRFRRCFATCGPPPGLLKKIGYVRATSKESLLVRHGSTTLVDLDRAQMQQWWSATSYEMQKLRDNPSCADSEFASIVDSKDPGLSYRLKFDPAETGTTAFTALKSLVTQRPRVAILREQGVNGYAEMAFAFRAAGFEAVDIHMTDILSGFSLDGFRGLAACGGFSYGDVLGAGQGWANSILMHENARRTFEAFFQRPDTFTLGVCNGCQMLSRLKELIPGAEHWPAFVENTSQQFEGRYSMVAINDADEKSIFFSGMSGSLLPIVVSHGEGRAEFSGPVGGALHACNEDGLIPLRYTDNYGQVTETYPFNPNGSPEGIAGVRSKDGRVLAMMPHPERTIMADVASWAPREEVDSWGMFGPWLRMFRNARKWVG
ncbi:catalytic activity protein [Cryphonectria parasitica EP155]|uniref:Phosphoribosylformylglycinamidine synthase n=1 Tax=Cryphonectria parasitica (strain ATCC 38755 / EP155) TaxID=660469 RepID=A0A9P4Y0L3_CRYP1|nr:catalytic activity protein [Cryphonectria parasitica EP155]KAF3764371.1 catalytic activity protein [Cryphonectria parasitica EP155]